MNPRRVPARLLAVIIINLVLLALYVWSRPGQTTTVRVEARGDTFTAYLDGRQAMQMTFAGIEPGGVSLYTFDSSGTPSLPTTAGVDRVIVEDLSSGEILLDEGFDEPSLAGWTPAADGRINDGLLTTDGAALTLVNNSFEGRDVAVTVTFRNVTAAVVGVRAQTGGTGGVLYRFDAFRDFRQFMSASVTGEAPVAGPPVELAHREYIKSMVSMLLRPYPLVLAGMLALIAVGLLAMLSRALLARRDTDARSPTDVPAGRERVPASVSEYGAPAILAGLSLFVLATTLVFMRNYQSGIPHWPDSTAYLFQAKIFASGRLAAPAPPVQESFDFFFPPLMATEGDRWSAIFPPGNASVLAIGEVAGVAWIVPPLLGVAGVVLLYAVGSKMYGRATGLLAAVVLGASPFFLMQSSNFMSHVTAMTLMLAALLCLQLSARRPVLYCALAGLAFGALFLTRPYTAALVAIPFGAVALSVCLPTLRERATAERIGAICGGFAVMLAFFLAFNFAATGDPFSSSYQSSNASRLGFGGEHSLARGLLNEQTHLAYLLLVLHAWPAYIGLAFVLVPLVVGTPNRWDGFNAASTLAIVSGAVLFIEHGTMQGPRLWFEAVPFLALLTARGVVLAGEASASVAGSALRRLQRQSSSEASVLKFTRTITTACACAILVALIAYYSLYGWTFNQRTPWSVIHVPAQSRELRGFNDLDNRMVLLLDNANLENALVLVEPCPHWQCYGSVFWMNTPTVDGDVVLAKNLPANNDALFQAFPDRRVFIASYDKAFLVPYGFNFSNGVPPGPPDQTRAPIARSLIGRSTP